MKKLFRGHYRPSDNEFSTLWESSTIIVDTNVLLNLYRYTSETREKLLSILREFKDRLWIPHQVAYEFHNNRLKVICDQQDAYQKIEEILRKQQKDLIEQLNEFRRHSLIKVESLIERCTRGHDQAIKTIADQKSKHPSLLDSDDILEAITTLFDSRVGTAYTEDQLTKIHKDAEARFSRFRPPGYKDNKSKQGDERFGDFIIWKQIIDHATATKSNVILVTDDTKEDWWTRIKGKTIGPRPELIDEIRAEASVDFYMYQTDQFMEMSKKSGKKSVPTAMLNEIRELRSIEKSKAFTDFILSETAEDETKKNLVELYNTLLERKIICEKKAEDLAMQIKKGGLGEHEINEVNNKINIWKARRNGLEKQINEISIELKSILRTDQQRRNIGLHRFANWRLELDHLERIMRSLPDENSPSAS